MRNLIVALLLLAAVPAMAQVDRHEVRAGNRKFGKDKFKESEIDYRKAVLKDSLSVAGQYNLASSLYRQEDYDGAGRALETVKEAAAAHGCAADYHFNAGDVALQKKDYAAAVEAFRNSLLLNPDDLEAKENYIYAKKMLENQQNGGGGNDSRDRNKDQDKNQDPDPDQDQNSDQNRDDRNNQGDDGNRQQPDRESGISPQQAQQMLKAIQAKEKETQDKVNREKAALLESKQKEKNW